MRYSVASVNTLSCQTIVGFLYNIVMIGYMLLGALGILFQTPPDAEVTEPLHNDNLDDEENFSHFQSILLEHTFFQFLKSIIPTYPPHDVYTLA